MRAFFAKYLNEIIGLTVMGLMTLALIAGQAEAELQQAAVEELRQVIEIRLTISD